MRIVIELVNIVKTYDSGAAAVRALREKGVTFNIYPNFRQDELGILTVPGGAVHVAWFQDPDGNVLSVTNA